MSPFACSVATSVVKHVFRHVPAPAPGPGFQIPNHVVVTPESVLYFCVT